MSEEIDCPVCNQGKLIDFTDKETGLEASICDYCEVILQPRAVEQSSSRHYPTKTIQCNQAQLVHNKWMRVLKFAVDNSKDKC